MASLFCDRREDYMMLKVIISIDVRAVPCYGLIGMIGGCSSANLFMLHSLFAGNVSGGGRGKRNWPL